MKKNKEAIKIIEAAIEGIMEGEKIAEKNLAKLFEENRFKDHEELWAVQRELMGKESFLTLLLEVLEEGADAERIKSLSATHSVISMKVAVDGFPYTEEEEDEE